MHLVNSWLFALAAVTGDGAEKGEGRLVKNKGAADSVEGREEKRRGRTARKSGRREVGFHAKRGFWAKSYWPLFPLSLCSTLSLPPVEKSE